MLMSDMRFHPGGLIPGLTIAAMIIVDWLAWG